MALSGEVLTYLIPTGGWSITGDDFDSIIYDDGVKAITKKQFEDGFAKVDEAKAKAEADKLAAKQSAQAKLAALGLTEEEVASILG
jgi:hypothetical protein